MWVGQACGHADGEREGRVDVLRAGLRTCGRRTARKDWSADRQTGLARAVSGDCWLAWREERGQRQANGRADRWGEWKLLAGERRKRINTEECTATAAKAVVVAVAEAVAALIEVAAAAVAAAAAAAAATVAAAAVAAATAVIPPSRYIEDCLEYGSQCSVQ